jgi:GNAT superfamily N-acetyltransferase
MTEPTILPSFDDIGDSIFTCLLSYEPLGDIEGHEPCEVLQQWEAKLFLPGYAEDETVDFEIATASGYRFDWTGGPGPGGERYSPFDVLDSHSAELAAYAALFDSDDELLEGYIESVFPATPLVIASRCQVDRRFRGHRIGPFLLGQALLELGGSSEAVVACQPSPYQLADDDPTRPAEQARLERIWANFGFERFEQTDVWWMQLGAIEDRQAALRKEVFAS